MTAVWYRDRADFELAGKHYFVNCDVRNELNGRRPLGDPKQVVHSIVNGAKGPPYMPRPFPKGIARVTAIEWYPTWRKDQGDFWPVKIRTDASQRVEVWELDEGGGYKRATGIYVIDGGYHLHWSWSRTTLGCGRAGLESWDQAKQIAEVMIEEFLAGGEVLIDVR